MDFGGGGGTRVIGDYILGPKIGSGSFAVVWRSRHRKSGTVVAVKEIDKKQLSPKVSENLFKEITILSTIDHPNIIRLFEAIQTKDRIYLVLEYCSGGDLAAYIHRHGKVSEATARHFMIQLAAGLQVLQEKNLIHRDLKPQNLLLATSGATPLMKIGDFGFARSLTPQGLADTLCGSPLYMAPEIIQNQKYDAKADLWSVGAILFQLVTGKPPFDGNSQLQLFQNILTSSEPQFPQEALKELHSDCLDLCRGLLRRNPVERLTFKEFFNHNFLQEPRLIMHVEQSLLHPSERSVVQHLVTSTSDMSQLHSGHHVESLVDDPVVVNSVLNDTLALQRNTGKKTIGIQAVETPVFGCSHLSKEPQVSRLMESIEKDYVLVNHHFASLEAFSEYFEASVQDNSTCKVSIGSSKRTNMETGVPMQTNDPSHCHAGQLEDPKSGEPVALAASRAFDVLGNKMHGTSSLSSSNRLELLHLYVQILAELSCEKYNAKLYLESFAVELVVLAIWKKALDVCESWMNKGVLPASTLANEARTSYGDVGSSQNMEKKINFCDPLSVYMWAKEGFIAAVDSAQTLSRHIQNMDGEAEMPDAMEIIFQEALLVGKSGAVDEYMENRGRAAASYSKAMLLLSFIVGEATNLPLNPPFLLTAANEKRILQYIHNLQSHQKSSSESSPKATHILLSE